MTYKKILWSLFALASMTACTKYDLANPTIQANSELSTALGRFKFVFSDFLKGDSLIRMGADSTIALRYMQDSLTSYKATDLLDKMSGGLMGGVNKTLPIGTLSVPNLNLAQSIALSQLASAFPVPLDDYCTNGGTTSVASGAFSTTTVVNSDWALLSSFQNVNLATGTLSLQLVNNFPFAIQNLTIEVINTNTGALVASVPMRNANNGTEISAAGGAATGSANLTGKTMTNQLSFRIGAFDCAGVAAGTVFLSTETLEITTTISNLKVKTGIAKLPAQSIGGVALTMPLATPNADQQFKELTFAKGAINYSVAKTTQANLMLALTFPTMVQNGVPITQMIPISEASTTGSISLENAVCDMASVAAQPYNQLPVQIALSVVTSGGSFVPVSETEQVTINFAFSDLEVGAAKGQFGNFEIDIPANSQNIGGNFDFLTPESKRLLFADPVMRLKTVNSFGLPINIDLLMTAKGALTGQENLGLATDAGRIKFDMARPTIGQIGSPAQLTAGVKVIDKNNSNIVQFMGILPKTISSVGKVTVRSTGATMDYFTADSRMKLGLEMDVPIKFSAENLTIRDTVTSFANLVTDATAKNVDYAAMDVQYTTRLPIGVTVTLATLTKDSLVNVVTDIVLPSAEAIDATGKVTAAKTGTFEVKVTAEQLLQLSAAPKVVMIMKVKTAGTGTNPVAIYTHYDLDMGIGMRIKTKFGK
jgi:hypothetical protein